MKQTSEALAMRVSRNTIISNMALFIFKLYAGIASGSGAMVSDAVHSASDVFSTIIVMAGIKVSNKKADKNHPYGHERLESIAAFILAAILCVTGLGIGYTGISNIVRGEYNIAGEPGMVALIAALVSIAVKEAMYWYTRSAALKVNSGALMADAWHHRSDALSSIGSFVGILGARLGLPIMDPIASVVISALIVKAAVDIFMDSARKLTDEACDECVEHEIRQLIAAQEGVIDLDRVKTRKFGPRLYVDIEISADGGLTLKEAHNVAQRVHDVLEAAFPDIKHCMVHVNPAEA